MKLREVFRYELAHQLSNRATWVFAAFLIGASFLLVIENPYYPGDVQRNAPAALAGFAVFVSFFMIVTAGLFGDAAVRDVQAGMDPLIYTTAVRKADYLGGRYLAALTTHAIVSLVGMFGLALPALVGYGDPAMFGPFRIAAYLQAWLLFLMPNIALIGALMFSVGILARHVLPVYLSGIGIFFGFLFVTDVDAWDPLGMIVLEEATRNWTVAEQNTRLIGFPTEVLLNRLFWLAIALVVLVVLQRVFRFRHPHGIERVNAAESARPGSVVVPRRGSDYAPERRRPEAARPELQAPVFARSFDMRMAARQTLAIARNSLMEIVASRWFVGALLAWAWFTMFLASNVGRGPFDSTAWPLTLLVVETILAPHATPIIYALIAVFAGELVWKDRDTSTAEIADATPVSDGAALLGRYLALVAIIAMFLATSVIGGMLIQAAKGYYHFELDLYFRMLLGAGLADFALLAAVALTIHVLVNHKYVGHIFVLIAFIAPFAAQATGLLRHHLLLYGTDPGRTVSDMNGFGPFLAPFVWFKLYWAAWALLLGVVTCVFWVRGRESGWRRRLRQAPARFTGSMLRTAAVAMVLILVLGGFIYYNTNVLNEYHASAEQDGARADYEKRYGRYLDLPQPTIESAGLRVEIYPDEPAVDLRGSYRLVNRTDASIDSVHVFVSPEVDTRAISLSRAAKAVVADAESGYHIYALERALNPGESVQLSFDVAFRRRGFPNDGIQTQLVENGAYFGRAWLPFIGYQPAFQLSDDETRERYGLDPRPPLPGPEVIAARKHRYEYRNEDKVRVAAILGTSTDQTAITSGVLRRAWTENGRRYFHYEMEAPQSFGAIVCSGKYEVHQDRWHDVALNIFHHPDHDFNIDTFVRSTKASLDYYSAQFGPYQGSVLRVVEVPRYDRFGRAHAGMVAFTEDNFYLRPAAAGVDALFHGTAHEVAHQWWGGHIKGAFGVRGSQAFLSESLANYSAMMVTEKTFGAETARQIHVVLMDRYLSNRERGDVPLLQVGDEAHIYYGKGAVVMYLLRDYLGEVAVNTALRRFIDKHRAGIPPYPTALDVYAELKDVTPDSLQYLLTDLFETVTFWDVSTERAVVEPTSNGEFVVTLDVVAKKLRVDDSDNESEVPMDDSIEVGIFAPGEGSARGEQIYLARHRIRSGAQTIRITVPREPARAGIDPWGKLIDRDGYDNVVVVEARDARGS